MKKLTVFLLVLVLTLLVSCGSASSDSAPMGFKEISEEGVTYHLYVPDEWVADVSTGMTSAYYDGRDPSNISMTAFELDRTFTSLDEYWAFYEEDLSRILADFAYVDEAQVKLDGVDAIQKIYTGTMSELSYKFMQLVAIKDNTVYIFTYTATTDKYDAHIEDVIAILDYFNFK